MWTLWKVLRNESMKKTHFSSSSPFNVWLLWGMFCFAFEMIGSVIVKSPIHIVSPPEAPDLSFYFYRSPGKAVRHLFIYCHKQQQIPPRQHFRYISYRKRYRIDKWIRAKTWSIREQHCRCLTSVRCLLAACANRRPGKEKYSVRLWTFSLCFWVAECSPLPWILRATCFHYSSPSCSKVPIFTLILQNQQVAFPF